MEEVMEKYVKFNNKFYFAGWSSILTSDEKFCTETKETKNFIYKTYKWLDSTIETFRFRKNK